VLVDPNLLFMEMFLALSGELACSGCEGRKTLFVTFPSDATSLLRDLSFYLKACSLFCDSVPPI
jgi:hypothetical protein